MIFNIVFITLWNLVVFLRLPHLTWLPGFLATWFTNQGLVIYKDFVDPHFPLSYLFLYPFLKLTNWNLETDPIIAVGISILTSLTIYYFGKKFLSKMATTISILIFSTLYWYFSTWVQFSQEALQGLMVLL